MWSIIIRAGCITDWLLGQQSMRPDFFAAFEDFQKKREMERNPHLFKTNQHRHIDYSLQPGQLIHLNIGGDSTNAAKPKATDSLWENPFEANSKNPFMSSDIE